MRTIIVGSRTIHNPRPIVDAISAAELLGVVPTVVLSADGVGGDRLAAKWAAQRGILVEVHVGEWEKHGENARAVRNLRMVEQADAVIAVRHWNDAGYVDDMVRPAKERGIEVVEWTA